jgi:rare lipoprotein A
LCPLAAYSNIQEIFMASRSLAAIATLIVALSTAAQAQNAPASAPAPAPASAPAAAPAAAEPAKKADATDGKVAYYGKRFNGRKTASGERFNAGALTMAHKTLPFGTMVKVTNLKNNKSVVVRVNDRGPTTPDRVGDLSAAAAGKIRMLRSGVIDAKLEVVGEPKPRMAKMAKKAAAKK